MTDDPAVARLPFALATALRMRAAGLDSRLIATALAIEPEGVDPLIELAEAKLIRLRADQP